MLLSSVVASLGLFLPPPAIWLWPVGGEHRIVRDFVAPETPWGPGHRGIDVDASSAVTLFAPVSGSIHFVGDVVSRGVVTIRAAEGVLVSMEPVTLELERGTRVRAGQAIGVVESGHCRPRCLHLGVRVGGSYVSPARFFGYERRAVLVPWSD